MKGLQRQKVGRNKRSVSGLNQTAIESYIPERHGFCRGGPAWPPTRGQPHRVAPTQGGKKRTNLVTSGLDDYSANDLRPYPGLRLKEDEHGGS